MFWFQASYYHFTSYSIWSFEQAIIVYQLYYQMVLVIMSAWCLNNQFGNWSCFWDCICSMARIHFQRHSDRDCINSSCELYCLLHCMLLSSLFLDYLVWMMYLLISLVMILMNTVIWKELHITSEVFSINVVFKKPRM